MEENKCFKEKMKNKMLFSRSERWRDLVKESLDKKEVRVFNFLNSHDLYFFKKDLFFRRTFEKDNINFIDGSVVSIFLSLTNSEKIKRMSGTEFMIRFFKDKKISTGKHLFIGSEKEDLELFYKKFPHVNKKDLFHYNPPYIKSLRFPEEEIKKIAKIIKSNNIDFIWVGLGCPKQNIFSYDLTHKADKKLFFNVGAAMDFVLEKKKKAPKIWLNLGLEWLYRFIIDFNHSKKKVWRSFISILYLLMYVRLK